ncbi:MAG: glycosyltransferase [Candidatus Paceibacterota bacterium]|jgi:glycosyltransferase involved in cell wall biosynthesis
MPHTHPWVTIIIPVYNEGTVIAQTVARVVSFLAQTEFPYSYDLCVVDNASTDDTWRKIEQLSRTHPTVTGLHLKEKGKGRAIRAGWAQARGDILTFMDADLSSDLASFRALTDAVALGEADLAMGNRLGVHSKIVTKKRFRKVASRIYNALTRAFLHTGIDDHQCGFKAMSADAFKALAPELTETGFFFDTELIALARKHGFRIHQEDIIWIDVPASKVSLVSDSLNMFWSVLRLARRLHAHDPA